MAPEETRFGTPAATKVTDRPGTLVHLPVDRVDGGHDPARRGDVDEWGRSEHMRELARRLYDPIYRRWFRAEWEGLENIPTDGGALRGANHAGAVPSDAPVIIHGIEIELQRAVYGLADHLFKALPVVGTLWSRVGGVVAHPDNAYRLLHDNRAPGLAFPGGRRAPASTSPSAPASAASAAAASSRSPCGPGCRSCPSPWSAPRRPCRSSPRSAPWPRTSGCPTVRTRPTV